MANKLLSFILFVIVGTTTMQAESTAYAYYSSNTLTFRYGEIPANSVQTWDVSDTGESVPEWASSSIHNNITTVVFHESFASARPKSCFAWFRDCAFLKGFKGLENLNTSEVTNMSRMFSNCTNIKELNLKKFITENVADMSQMFEDCNKLTSLEIINFVTKNVYDMNSMFSGCSQIKDLDLFPSFNNNRYEQQLKQIYDELKKIDRTNRLKELYK